MAVLVDARLLPDDRPEPDRRQRQERCLLDLEEDAERPLSGGAAFALASDLDNPAIELGLDPDDILAVSACEVPPSAPGHARCCGHRGLAAVSDGRPADEAIRL